MARLDLVLADRARAASVVRHRRAVLAALARAGERLDLDGLVVVERRRRRLVALVRAGRGVRRQRVGVRLRRVGEDGVEQGAVLVDVARRQALGVEVAQERGHLDGRDLVVRPIAEAGDDAALRDASAASVRRAGLAQHHGVVLQRRRRAALHVALPGEPLGGQLAEGRDRRTCCGACGGSRAARDLLDLLSRRDVRGALVQPAVLHAASASSPAPAAVRLEPRGAEPALDLRAARIAPLGLEERGPVLGGANHDGGGDRASHEAEGTTGIGAGTKIGAGTIAGTKLADSPLIASILRRTNRCYHGVLHGESLSCKQGVRGSSPLSGSRRAPLSSRRPAGSARPRGRSGRGRESGSGRGR